MSTRFLLIGDVHLREGEQFDDSLACLAFAVRIARERGVNAVMLAGDVFEGKSTPAERNAFGDFLSDLTGAASVYVVRGNHDQPLDLEIFNGYPDVVVFERPTLHQHPGFDLLFVPWPERAYLAAQGYAGEAGDQAGSAALTAMLRAMVATREDPTRPLIILGHLQVLGAISSSAQPLIGKAIEAVLGDLQDLGAAAIVLGHVHKPQQLAPGIEYVGSLTVHDFGEETEEKRIGILTVEDDGSAAWEWIPVPCQRWVTVEAYVDVEGIIREGVGGMKLGDAYYSEANLSGANVRYRYACTEEEAHRFDEAAIRRRFAGAHTLKIESEISRTDRAREGAAKVAAAPTVADKLRAYGEATGITITDSHLKKLEQLESEVAP